MPLADDARALFESSGKDNLIDRTRETILERAANGFRVLVTNYTPDLVEWAEKEGFKTVNGGDLTLELHW